MNLHQKEKQLKNLFDDLEIYRKRRHSFANKKKDETYDTCLHIRAKLVDYAGTGHIRIRAIFTPIL